MKQHLTPTNGFLAAITVGIFTNAIITAVPPYLVDPQQEGRFLERIEHIVRQGNENKNRIDAHDQIGWHYLARENFRLQEQRLNTLESAMERMLAAIRTQAEIGIDTQKLLQAIANNPTRKKQEELR